MTKKRVVSLILFLGLAMNVTFMPASAENAVVSIKTLECEAIDFGDSVVDADAWMRATNKVDWSVSAGENKKATTALSLEAGDVVRINCTYTPGSADIDFGLVAPDGLFYFLSGENGSFNQSIRVEDNGAYYFAVRNNSNKTVTILGFVYY